MSEDKNPFVALAHLWAESNEDEDEDTIQAIQVAMVEDVLIGRVETFRRLLADVFPLGTVEEKLNRGPLTVTRKVGDHWVGFVGAVRPGDAKMTWQAFWRQNVMNSLGQPWQNAVGQSHCRGATIEKSTKRIKGHSGAAAWLSKTHYGICKVSSETIRSALHPDNFMQDTSATFRAAYNLHIANASWDDVDALITQPLPWRDAVNGHACVIFRYGTPIGLAGVKNKDNYWRYGGQINLAYINAPLFRGITMKFKNKISTSYCKDADAAKVRAERLYARRFYEWLVKYSSNEGLRSPP